MIPSCSQLIIFCKTEVNMIINGNSKSVYCHYFTDVQFYEIFHLSCSQLTVFFKTGFELIINNSSKSVYCYYSVDV